MRVYIAGPYGDTNPEEVIAANVRRADRVARAFMRLGDSVYVPHKMSWGWEKDTELKRYDFLHLDETFLRYWATAIYQIPGVSSGADYETTRARELGLRVLPIEYIPLATIDRWPDVC